MTCLNMPQELLRTLAYPLLAKKRHPAAFAQLRSLQALEFAPASVLAAHGVAQRARLLRHAAAHVPFYRARLGAGGAPAGDDAPLACEEAWRRLPVLTKAMLRGQPDLFLADNAASPRANASGGSTGNPVRFFQDGSYWSRARAAQWLMESWWGIRPGDSTAALWGADRDLADSGWKDRLASRIAQTEVCNVFKVAPGRLETFAARLHAWQPRLLMGYASALGLFARFVLQNPRLQIRPHAIRSSAEVLSPQVRSELEAAFGAPVYDFYGSREVNNLAAECGAHSGLHVNALTRYLEIVDERGEPAAPGVPGRILVTDFTNFAMPFIRYENEDIGVWSPHTCSCGRSLPLLQRVLGRKSDFLRAADGSLVHGEYFTHWFYQLPQVQTFQLVQSAPDRVQLDVVLAAGVSAAASRTLLLDLGVRLRRTLGAGIACEARAVPAIARPENGKHRFTVSLLDQNSAGEALPAAKETVDVAS